VPARLSTVLSGLGIDTPTPIQAATLPDAFAGRDVLGRGRTGSGKTYAFLLPLVARLSDGRSAKPKSPRALILAPTRELANQIDLDTLELQTAGADLEYQTDASAYHFLVPMEDVQLGVSGSLEPGLEDCLNARMSSAPIAVESLALGTYLCYLTGQGATGQARLVTLDPADYTLTLDLLTWALP